MAVGAVGACIYLVAHARKMERPEAVHVLVPVTQDPAGAAPAPPSDDYDLVRAEVFFFAVCVAGICAMVAGLLLWQPLWQNLVCAGGVAAWVGVLGVMYVQHKRDERHPEDVRLRSALVRCLQRQ
mmetsp:Transcript_14606/g.35408  ORF Transcript_14606/g.35408 Transcript_14606/m.35408 type:complete len:125 (+) Transcript_14606:1-375(+)